MFNVFARTWWTLDKSWPNGLRPQAGCKTYLAKRVTEAEAKRLCQEYNSIHNPGRLSLKAEYEEM